MAILNDEILRRDFRRYCLRPYPDRQAWHDSQSTQAVFIDGYVRRPYPWRKFYWLRNLLRACKYRITHWDFAPWE